MEIKNYRMPAEWENQAAVWITYPHNADTWPSDLITAAQLEHLAFAAQISTCTNVYYVLNNQRNSGFIIDKIATFGGNPNRIRFFDWPTNDSWIRDYGPIIVKDKNGLNHIAKFDYNAWGGKYPPFDDDNSFPLKASEFLGIKVLDTSLTCEGGAIETNGGEIIMTTKNVLLNPNRNNGSVVYRIEELLKTYLGANDIFWFDNGISGDDTDGHVDDFARFANKNTILIASDENKSDEDHELLSAGYRNLSDFLERKYPEKSIIKVEMPEPVYLKGQRLPASYLNFLITNKTVIVPLFSDENDSKALETISSAFPLHRVVGLPSNNLVWGLGSFHCLSQQLPL